MATIITYDVPHRHTELKGEMFARGYKDRFPGVKNCETIYLPNTTLYHATKSVVASRDELKTVCRQLEIELERCIAIEMGAWAAICGEPFN